MIGLRRFSWRHTRHFLNGRASSRDCPKHDVEHLDTGRVASTALATVLEYRETGSRKFRPKFLDQTDGLRAGVGETLADLEHTHLAEHADERLKLIKCRRRGRRSNAHGAVFTNQLEL
jgi:hypothetical protein